MEFLAALSRAERCIWNGAPRRTAAALLRQASLKWDSVGMCLLLCVVSLSCMGYAGKILSFKRRAALSAPRAQEGLSCAGAQQRPRYPVAGDGCSQEGLVLCLLASLVSQAAVTEPLRSQETRAEPLGSGELQPLFTAGRREAGGAAWGALPGLM